MSNIYKYGEQRRKHIKAYRTEQKSNIANRTVENLCVDTIGRVHKMRRHITVHQ